MRKLLPFFLSALAMFGCAKPRTSAATQPSPAAFDPAQSSPEAIAVVDASLEKLGGAATWNRLKQLRFAVDYKMDGKVMETSEHAWDRWNGRHYYSTPDMSTMGGEADDIKYIEARHDLFDKDATPSAYYDGNLMPRKDALKPVADATTRLTRDLYFLAMAYKLKDPGVKLAIDDERVEIEGDLCKPSCTSVKVTFDPAVGNETWYVSYNADTKLPVVIGKQKGPGRIGFEITGWTTAGGLRWPSGLRNLGMKGEVIEFRDIAVGEPDDSLYMPTIQ